MSLGFTQGSLLPPSAGYTAQGVHFDGSTNLRRTTAYTGATNGPSILFSFWFKQGGTDATDQWIYSGSGETFIHRGDTNKLIIVTENTSFQNSYVLVTNSQLFTAGGGWHHVMGSTNGTTATAYIDGVVSADTPSTGNFTMAYDEAGDRDIGGDGFQPYTGDLADFYINMNVYMDLTVLANRQLFISGGAPVDLGSNGSTPTGSAPTIYLHGAAASWHLNDGAGGDFTVQAGALTAASTNPP